MNSLQIKVKALSKKVIKSETPISDFLSILKSIIAFPKNTYIHNSFIVKNRGKITAKGLLWIGISSNKIGLDYNAKGQLRIGPNGYLEAGNNVRIARASKLFVNANFKIGDKSYIQPNANIVCNAGIEIGENCAISWNVQILDDDLHSIIINENIANTKAPIKIGDHVWIGCNVTILKGVIIGDGAVIGAGSIVNKDIPPHCLAGGVPAKIIKENVSWK